MKQLILDFSFHGLSPATRRFIGNVVKTMLGAGLVFVADAVSTWQPDTAQMITLSIVIREALTFAIGWLGTNAPATDLVPAQG